MRASILLVCRLLACRLLACLLLACLLLTSRSQADASMPAHQAAAHQAAGVQAAAHQAAGDESAGVEAGQGAPFPGSPSDWNGFRRYDFQVDGRPVLVVAPHQPAVGRPWIWHGEFFGHQPAPDIELLKRGFHIAYIRVPDMLGAPRAVAHWNAFYQELTTRYGLGPRPGLVGLSRGGLYCYNWAIANAEKVACIYADAPVCDFKSWPGGRGRGKGSPRDWQLVLDVYGFASDEEALTYQGNPVDQLAPLAQAGVPLLHVYGDADEVVPWEENTGVVAERYRDLGGSITLIAKPEIGHHPHGLEDCTPIVEFLAQHTLNPTAAVPRPAGDTTLRILSYNIHHAEGVDGVLDVQRIADVIRNCQADLVALQEVDQHVARTQSKDQPAELGALTGLHVVFGKNISLQGGSYGNAILSRWPIRSHQNHLLPCYDKGEQRGVLVAEILLPDGTELQLMSTHFDHRPSHAEREASAAAINQQFVTPHPALSILAGDLNATSDSRPLEILQQQWTVTSAVPQPTIPVHKPSRQIDFILFRPAARWHVVESRVLDERTASDHRPLLSVLQYTPAHVAPDQAEHPRQDGGRQ